MIIPKIPLNVKPFFYKDVPLYKKFEYFGVEYVKVHAKEFGGALEAFTQKLKMFKPTDKVLVKIEP